MKYQTVASLYILVSILRAYELHKITPLQSGYIVTIARNLQKVDRNTEYIQVKRPHVN